jgi:prepilin-type N-terminal cleavage/methylation domain-containing protein
MYTPRRKRSVLFLAKAKRGFTLVESMVVVGVLGLAIGIGLTTLNVSHTTDQAKDAVRKSDLNVLHKAFVQYYVENRCIPPTQLWDGYQCGDSVPAELAPYLSKIPCDPETNEKYAYEPLDKSCKQCNGGCGTCVGFRLLAQLKDEKTEPPPGAGCKKDAGCGKKASNGKPYNYGIAMSNACTIPVPSTYPTPTPLGQKLQLTSLCSNDPTDTRNWRVRNSNTSDIEFSWKVNGSNQSGVGTVPASVGTTPGETTFSSITESGANTTVIYVNGVQQDVKASGGAVCTPTPTITTAPTATPLPSATPLPPTPTKTPAPTPTPPPPTATPEPGFLTCGSGELVKNGSFEVDANNDRIPDDWTRFLGGGTYPADQGVLCNQASNGRCSFVSKAPFSTGDTSIRYYVPIRIPKGTEIFVSFDSKKDTARNASNIYPYSVLNQNRALFSMHPEDNSKDTMMFSDNEVFVAGLTTSWKKYGRHFIAAKNLQGLYFTYRPDSLAPYDTVYLDNVSITCQNPAPPPITVSENNSCPGQVLLNGSFEQASTLYDGKLPKYWQILRGLYTVPYAQELRYCNDAS